MSEPAHGDDFEYEDYEPHFTELFVSVARGGYRSYGFPGPNTDLVLKSSDDVMFYVHSLILKLSSPVFGDMLRIPRPPVSPNDLDDEVPVVDLTEPAEVLSLLLDIIYPGRGQLQNANFGERLSLLQAVGAAATKYDIWSALEAIKTFLVSPRAIARYPAVYLYGIACELRFDNEAKRLSTETLKCSLNDAENQTLLEKVDSLAIVKLFQLHYRRKAILLNALSDHVGDPPYDANIKAKYGGADKKEGYVGSFARTSLSEWLLPQYRTAPAYHDINKEWAYLKFEVARVMEKRPDGSAFFEHEDAFFNKPTFAKVLDGRKKIILSKEFKSILEGMPNEVDLIFS